MRASRPRQLNRGATSLDAALTGVGADVAAPPLARLGRGLQRAELGPHEPFRSDLRRALVAATVEVPVPARAPLRHRPATHSLQWFATRLTAGLAAAGVMVAGVGVASAHALPGDALYGVKRDTEALQLNLAHGNSSRGLLHLQFAASRLSEVHALLRRAGITDPAAAQPGTVKPVAMPRILAATLRSTLSTMDVETSAGASELTQSYLQKRQSASLTKLAAFTERQESALASVLPALPAPAAAASLHVLHTVAAQTTALLAEPPAPGPTGPAALPGPASPTPAAPVESPSVTPSPVSTESPMPGLSSADPGTSDSPAASASAAPDSSTPKPTASPSTPPKTPTQSAASTPTPATGSDSPAPLESPTPSAGVTASSAPATPTETP